MAMHRTAAPGRQLYCGPHNRFTNQGPKDDLLIRAEITERRLGLAENGAQGRNRTSDTRIFNPLLYQLSYLGAAMGGVYR
jgi:hypothetical protein